MTERAYTERTLVLHGHLLEMYEALDAARGYHVADDLAQQYKKVTSMPQQSNLTAKLERALSRVEGYLAQGVDNDVPDE